MVPSHFHIPNPVIQREGAVSESEQMSEISWKWCFPVQRHVSSVGDFTQGSHGPLKVDLQEALESSHVR